MPREPSPWHAPLARAAKLVGWFDRVWSYGFAYGDCKTLRALDKVLVIAIAGNTKEMLISQGRLQSMENVMLEDRIHDRAKYKEFVLLGGTERNNPHQRDFMRSQHIETAHRLGQEL